jgi:hypothetical protein
VELKVNRVELQILSIKELFKSRLRKAMQQGYIVQEELLKIQGL